MDKLPHANFVFFMNFAYVHPRVLLDRRFCEIRPATREEVRRAALEEEALAG